MPTSTPTDPFVSHIYTADPSAHSFNGRIYVYPSHDRESNIGFNDRGDQYDMVDYHVLSMDKVDGGGETTDHGVALKVEDVIWASKQLWAPDAFKGRDGRYWLCFPARDQEGIFRLGLAHSSQPEGPFTPHPEPIPSSFSIDPATFVDTDGEVYCYFGGIWGGQLQCYSSPEGGKFNDKLDGPHEPSGKGVKALCPRVAKLTYNPSSTSSSGSGASSSDLGAYKDFDHPAREIIILDPDTKEPVLADDHEKRFFEASWMHEKDGVYYFSYSTGDTHLIAYATGDNPYGPFTYRGSIIPPVVGWTTHHSIVKHDDRWWLFFHDCEMSKGVDHLRSVRAREIWYDSEGRITIEKPE